MRSFACVLILLCMLVCTGGLYAADMLVYPDGSGEYATIQDAVDAAVDGDVIQLMDGVFTGPGNYYVNMHGKAITVEAQGINPANCIVDVPNLPGQNARGFVCYTDEGPETVFRGFTIRNGNSDGLAETGGGAIYVLYAFPTIENMIFEDNWTTGGGGAIAVFCNTSGANISHCTFIGNTAGIGGAIYAQSSAVTIDHCTFIDNGSSYMGGAVGFNDIYEGLNSVVNCTFYGNESTQGSSIFSYSPTTTVVNCILAAGSGIPLVIQDYDPEITCLSYTNVFGNEAGNWMGNIGYLLGVNGNISEDPLFICPELGNFGITEASPCIDAGDPNTPFDPDETIADIGAFYYFQDIDVEEGPEGLLPESIVLQNYPNPFNGFTEISFDLPLMSTVDVRVFNALGLEVEVLGSGQMQAGHHSMTFNASELPSGLYFVRLNTETVSVTHKVILLK